MPFEIRPYRDADLTSIYKICMQTADGGKDASHLFTEQQLIGDFYAVPYVILESDVCWVVSRGDEVCGYIVGCKSSQSFSLQCEEQWFPTLRTKYPLASKSISPLNDRLLRLIHDGYQPRPEFANYPAHLHINLLGNTQGHGLGAKLINAFIDNLKTLTVAGLHLEVSRDNAGAISFYEKMGFEVICEFEHSIGYGMCLYPC
ncbi:GNAT family N-acetyltransferase [Psychromonas sp. Urea-02u-13]|uniref:GNAT family N-acetyltransferase n=1 Tax=Psychromonas sp. Urea-02u-13 TaxID=2058326 RepID=UPI000C33A867|nr:GNAT family N-acetyltransferase [Psychromonas sp. Urea-02u-13]PKG38235.1 N-acetyltransferase [Psychromonas sp. Urea-02u-13]